MKLSTIIAILGAAIASSRTVGVPESGQDVQDIDIAEGFGDRIPGQNPFTFCKGDRIHDGVCREPCLFQSPIIYLSSFWYPSERCSSSPAR